MSNATAVRERPIIFTGESVRAILGGSKSQTRRVMKPQMELREIVGTYGGRMLAWPRRDGGAWLWPNAREDVLAACPYGVVGDRPWVRETWKPAQFENGDSGITWRADRAVADVDHDDSHRMYPVDWKYPEQFDREWKPSIHMPRWASRIMLEITDVRVERLQDISPDDAIAEGLAGPITKDGHISKYGMPDTDGLPGSPGWPWHRWRQSPVDAYESLWDEINGKRGHPWSSNPWVWALTFRMLP